MKRAIYTCAVIGGLVGYGEAAYIQKLSKLYLTLNGRIGITLAAVLLYAAYGGAAGAVLFPLWRRFWRGARERAVLSSAAMAWSFLYGFGYLVVSMQVQEEVYSFFLWGAGALVVSAVLALAAGWACGRLLRGGKGVVIAVAAFIGITAWMVIPALRPAAPPGELPNVVLVTIDTVRADRIRVYGHDRIETPTIDRVASEGVLFENAISQSPLTNPSHFSILSSTYPHQTGVIVNHIRHPRGITTVVDELRKRGYRTAAFVSTFVLDSLFGFGVGFDIYDDDCSRVKGYRSLFMVRVADEMLREAAPRFWLGPKLYRIAGETTDEALSWLKVRAKSPFFLWVHYFDPHGPYDPPPPYSGMYYEGRKDDPDNRSMEGIEKPFYWPPSTLDFTDINYPIAQYDAEITYADAELGRVLDEIDSRFPDTVFIIVGDHGESLTEHGYYFRHGKTLYDEQVRVPLVIRSRGRIEPARVPDLVENVDIAPTILELAGIDVPDSFRGESLLPLMRGEAARAKEWALSETGLENKDGAVDIAYRTERYKLIVKPGEGVELYDLKSDPGELRDISAEREDLVREYEERIRSVVGERLGKASAVMDSDTEEKLRSLGYLR